MQIFKGILKICILSCIVSLKIKSSLLNLLCVFDLLQNAGSRLCFRVYCFFPYLFFLRLNYCNSFFCGCPNYLVWKLQKDWEQCCWASFLNPQVCSHFSSASLSSGVLLSRELSSNSHSCALACWLERWTRDRKNARSNPSRSGRRIFFSRANFVCWLLIDVHFTPMLPQCHMKDPSHSAKNACGSLHRNMHTPLTQQSWSGLTMLLSRHSVGTY